MVAETIDNTAGPVAVGAYLTSALFGISILQTVNYFQNYDKDSLFVRFAVVLSFIFDIIHVVVVMEGSYVYTVGSIADPEKLAILPWAFRSMTFLSGFNVVVVRIFFVNRIRILSKSKFVTAFHGTLVVVSFCAAMACASRIAMFTTWAQIAAEPWVVYGTRGTSMSTDLCIASTMFYYLKKSASNTSFSGTSELLNTLVHYVVGTGLITAVWDIVEMSLYAGFHGTLIFIPFFFMLPKLHANAMLASLNARRLIKRRIGNMGLMPSDAPGTSIGMQNRSLGERDVQVSLPHSTLSSKGRAYNGDPHMEVGIKVMVESDSDYNDKKSMSDV